MLLDEVYSTAWKAARSQNYAPEECAKMAVEARLKHLGFMRRVVLILTLRWITDHGPREHPVVKKYLNLNASGA